MNEREDDQRVVAAEYLLGLLDPSDARAVQARAATDPQLAAAIERWRRDLAPLTGAPPPAAVWARIAATIGVPAGDTGSAATPPDADLSTLSPTNPVAAAASGLSRAGRIALAIGLTAAVAAGVALVASQPRAVPEPSAVPAPITVPTPDAVPPSIEPPIPNPLNSPPPARPPGRDPVIERPTAPPIASLPIERPSAPPPSAPPPTAPSPTAPSPTAPVPRAPTRSGGERQLAEATLLPIQTGVPLRATVNEAGDVALRPTAPIIVANGKRLHLWFQPRGATRPRLVGELPPAGGALVIGSTAPTGSPVGGVLMITEDPEAEPARPLPGRTRFQGLLRRAGV